MATHLALAVDTPAKHDRTRRTVDLRDGDVDRCLHRHQAAIRGLPLLQALKLQGVGGDVGHVQAREQFLGGGRVVVGRPAHQRKAGQGNQGIDGRAVGIQEETFNRGRGIQPRGEGRHDLIATRFQCGDHGVIVAGIVGQNIRTHDQQAHDTAPFCRVGVGRRGKSRAIHGDALGKPGVIEPVVGIIDRRPGFQRTAHALSFAVRIAIDQQAYHAGQVFVGAGQPVL